MEARRGLGRQPGSCPPFPPEVRLEKFHEPGIFHYSVLLLSEDKSTLYVGAREAVFALNALNVSEKQHEVRRGRPALPPGPLTVLLRGRQAPSGLRPGRVSQVSRAASALPGPATHPGPPFSSWSFAILMTANPGHPEGRGSGDREACPLLGPAARSPSSAPVLVLCSLWRFEAGPRRTLHHRASPGVS